jgi:cytoskeletal protein CcmA (bactofilin family)
MFDRRKGRNAEQQVEPVTAEPPAPASQPTPTPTPTSRITAMIGASIKIKGDITGEENLVVEGQVEGQINLANHDLTIGDSGQVTADLKAKTVQIHGTVNGDIAGSELVVVSKTGRVLGNIVAPRVTLEDGAQFKGSIDMSPSAEQSKSDHSNQKGPKHSGAKTDSGNEEDQTQAVA